MRKSHFNDEFLVLLGHIISRLFTCSNAEKNKLKKTKVACSSPISMIAIDLHIPMFVERKFCYSALFTNLVGWHAGAVSFPL